MEVTPVPSTKNYTDSATGKEITPNLTSEDLQEYIKERVSEIDTTVIPSNPTTSGGNE